MDYKYGVSGNGDDQKDVLLLRDDFFIRITGKLLN
jgi:hypothetical protein